MNGPFEEFRRLKATAKRPRIAAGPFLFQLPFVTPDLIRGLPFSFKPRKDRWMLDQVQHDSLVFSRRRCG